MRREAVYDVLVTTSKHQLSPHKFLMFVYLEDSLRSPHKFNTVNPLYLAFPYI